MGVIPIDSAPLQREYMTGIEIWLLKRMEPVYRHYPWKSLLKSGSRGVAESEYGRNLKMGSGALCTARDGILYIAGPFEGVSSATAEVTAEKTLVLWDPDTEERRVVKGPEARTFTLQGEKEGEELLVFHYRNGEPDLFPEQVPEAQQDLEDVSDLWYRIYLGEEEDISAGYGLLHMDLPVHVTLHGESGVLLDTLDLTVDTYELHEW